MTNKTKITPDAAPLFCKTPYLENATLLLIPMLHFRMCNISNFQAWHVPPNSPNLNTVDYAVWSALQQQVYHRQKFNTVEELKKV